MLRDVLISLSCCDICT